MTAPRPGLKQLERRRSSGATLRCPRDERVLVRVVKDLRAAEGRARRPSSVPPRAAEPRGEGRAEGDPAEAKRAQRAERELAATARSAPAGEAGHAVVSVPARVKSVAADSMTDEPAGPPGDRRSDPDGSRVTRHSMRARRPRHHEPVGRLGRPVVDWTAADLVAVRSTWDYDSRLPTSSAGPAASARSLLHGLEVFRWNTDKSYLVDWPPPASLSCRPSWPTIPGPTSVRRRPPRPAVVKPRVGAGGRGMRGARRRAPGARRHRAPGWSNRSSTP